MCNYLNNNTTTTLPCDTVFSIGIDPEGNKWFGTINGEAGKFNGTTWEMYNRWNSKLPGYSIHRSFYNPPTVLLDFGPCISFKKVENLYTTYRFSFVFKPQILYIIS